MSWLFITPDFTFSHQRLLSLDLDTFAESFQRLSPDKYNAGNYRFRRYSQFTGHASNLIKKTQEVFIQSRDVNYLNSDIDRNFESLENQLIVLPQFEQLVQTVNQFFGYDPYKTTLGIHQIRIICSGRGKGLPVPEGIHQDGFDLIAICCIARHNIRGAETQLYQHPDEKPVYNCTMQPGDIIYCNDRALYHYTSPIEADCKDIVGFRDMFVITVSLGGQQWQETTPNLTSTSSDNSFQPLSA